MTHSKICFKCEQEKPISEFYRHAAMADGYLNKCKDCTRGDVAKHRAENLEKVRTYDRERGKNPERIKQATAITKAWRSEDRRRSKCHNAVARAVKSGTLIPQPCKKCGSVQVIAHHEDYDKPLWVIWFCQACHKQHHEALRT